MKNGDYFRSELLTMLTDKDRKGLFRYFDLVGVHVRSWKKDRILKSGIEITFQYVDDRNILMGEFERGSLFGKEYSLEDLKKLINLASFE